MIWTIICCVLAAIFAIISALQFCQKGFVFNNAYIWATKKERETMDKKPHYRQSAIVFALCAALFLSMAAESAFTTGWLWLLTGALAGAVLVFAVVSSAKEQIK